MWSAAEVGVSEDLWKKCELPTWLWKRRLPLVSTRQWRQETQGCRTQSQPHKSMNPTICYSENIKYLLYARYSVSSGNMSQQVRYGFCFHRAESGRGLESEPSTTGVYKVKRTLGWGPPRREPKPGVESRKTSWRGWYLNWDQKEEKE